MTHWKGEALIRAKPNTDGVSGRPHPRGNTMVKRRPNRRDKCAVPGCGRTLGGSNAAGVCRDHYHHVDCCQCAICVGKRGKADE